VNFIKWGVCSRLSECCLSLHPLLQPTCKPHNREEAPPAPKRLPAPPPQPKPQPPPQQQRPAPQQQQLKRPRPGALPADGLLANAPAVARTGLPQRAARRNWKAVALAGEEWGESEDDEDWGGDGIGADDSSSGPLDDGEGETDEDASPTPAARGGKAAGRKSARQAATAASGGAVLQAVAIPAMQPAVLPPPPAAATAAARPPAPAAVPHGDDDSGDEDYSFSDDMTSDEDELDEGPVRKRAKKQPPKQQQQQPAPKQPPPPRAATRPRRIASSGGDGDGNVAVAAPAAAAVARMQPPAHAPAPAAPSVEEGRSLLHTVAGSFVAPRGAPAATAAAAAAVRAAALAEAEEDGIGRAARHQDRWLAQAGMVLRDPPTQHLLAAAAVGRLHRCVDERTLPRADLALSLMLQLMQLGADARRQLRDRRYSLPSAPARQLAAVWPQLVDVLAEAALDPQPGSEERVRPHGSEDGWQELVGAYKGDEVVRKVVQVGGGLEFGG